MEYRIRQITPPVGNIITRDEVKQWLSESSTHSDEVIDEVIATVTTILDGQKSRIASTVLPTTWEMAFWAFPEHGELIRLPLPPVVRLNSFEYDNDAGTVSNVTNTYLVYEHGHESVGSWDNWPTNIKEKPPTEPIRIQYDAGYASATPAPIKQAALAICAHIFDNRTQYQTAAMVANHFDPAIQSILATYDLR